MKIQTIETFSTPFVSLARITVDDGSQGWGQLSTYNADISTTILHRQVAPWVLEQDISSISDIDNLVDYVFEKEHKFPGSYLCRALAGIDTALYDLLAKKIQKPVYAMLGGKKKSLRVYASSMRRDITPQEEARRFLDLRDKHGYDAFKFRVGAECGRNQDEYDGRTETIIATVSNAFKNDNIALLVDGNSCYAPKQAIAVGKILQDYGICHFEEPCPYWQPQWTKEVTQALHIDVAGGEQDNNLTLWQYLIDDHAMNIAQPDICYLGGIARTMRVVKMANKANIPITPHCANLSLVTLFTLHLMAAIDGAGPYVEFSIEDARYYPWQYGIFDNFPTVHNGRIDLSDAPGWGITINTQWLKNARYDISTLN